MPPVVEAPVTSSIADAARHPIAPSSTTHASLAASPALHALHNTVATLPTCTSKSTVPCLPLAYLPQEHLDAVSDALATGPITLDLLHVLLSSGFGGTTVARHLGEELAARCELPPELSPDAQAAWREVLLDAIHLPATAWELEAMHERSALTNAPHPLLKALRDALYRPHDLSRPQWQAHLTQHRDTDCHQLALDWQRQHLQGRDTTARHGWALEALRLLAPDAPPVDLRRALQDIRSMEQHEGGLLDPRLGLRRLVHRDAVKIAPDGVPATLDPKDNDELRLPPAVSDGATHALANLLLDASRATLCFDAPVRPVGRFDSVANTLTTLLSLPGQLDGLRHWGARLALAAERVTRGPHPVERSAVRDATRGYVAQSDWPAPVQAADCGTPDPRDALDSPILLHRQMMEALAGTPPKGQALAVPGQCRVEQWTASGLRVEEAGRIDAFMRRQLPKDAGADALRQAYAHVIGTDVAHPQELPAMCIPLPTTGSLETGHAPRALAGALTDQGLWPMPVGAPTGAFPGAMAQLPGQMPGHAPLLLLQGLINSIRTPSWWRAIPGHVVHSPQGLLQALEDLFALAGMPLRDRPPSGEALMRFLDSPQGQALLQAIDQMPELAPWQRDQIDRGGEDTRVYVFMRLLKQLMRPLHAHAHATHTGTALHADHAALYQLARIGDAAGQLLAELNLNAPDAGRSYFQRVLQKTRPAAAAPPSANTEARIEQHMYRARPQPPGCPPDTIGIPKWLMGAPNAVVTEASGEALGEADQCLLRIASLVSGYLHLGTPDDWRDVTTNMTAWRARADALVASDPETPAWETAIGVLFHNLAGYLAGYVALQPEPHPPHDLQDLRVLVHRLIAPLQQLYAAVELPLDDADPYFANDYDIFDRFHGLAGVELSSAAMRPEQRAERPATLPLHTWLARFSGQQLGHALCPPSAISVRDGLERLVDQALNATTYPTDDGLPAVWHLIVHGPDALHHWLDTPAGRHAGQAWLGALTGHAVPHDVDTTQLDVQTRMWMLREAVLAQLPEAARVAVPTADEIPGLFAHGDAPVLSLAAQLGRLDPSLLRVPGQALRLAVALLAGQLPASARRMPLRFPLWPAPPAVGNTTTTAETEGALLPERWLASPLSLSSPTVPTLDTHALPSLVTLLSGFGLDVLHPQDPAQAPHPADLWELMSRTQAFAELGQQLLNQTGWVGTPDPVARSPQDEQTCVAQALLQRYVGRARIEGLRTRLKAPNIVDSTFAALQQEVRSLITAQQPHAPRAGVDLLQWLLLRELGQPALMVAGIPDTLYYGRTLEATAFLHGVMLLEALEPGASARATFAQLSGLAAQLASAAAHAGDNDALHDTWARTMLQPALLYALAHGQLPDMAQLDAITAEQATAALDFLQQAQQRQALHIDQLGTAPPRRRELATRTLTAAGVDAAYWQKRPIDLPSGYLQRHGITPSPLLANEKSLFDFLLSDVPDLSPSASRQTQERVNEAITANDSLQMLIAADAYQWNGGPSTLHLFDTAFDSYRRKVQAGVGGLIEDLLRTLPGPDAALLASSTCTAVRVQVQARKAYQGLLLRCQPPHGAPAVHFEIVPSAGIARRALVDPRSGEWVDVQSLLDGTTAVVRSERVVPVAGLNGIDSATAVDMTQPGALATISADAARHLLEPWLDTIRTDILDDKTQLEKRWQEEKDFARHAAEFLVPYFKCVEDLVDGHTGAAALDCTVDALGTLVPAGRLVASTVRIVGAIGERTVMSLSAETGRALGTFAREIASQSGLFLLRDLGRGALWVGSRAWNSALHHAGWLRGVLRGERDLAGAAHGLDNALAHGAVPPLRLEQLSPDDLPLAVGTAGTAPPTLLVNRGGAWHRFDPVEGAAFGPALDEISLVQPLPSELPAERMDEGVRVNVGDATAADFIETAPGAWEVWIDGTPYRLDPLEGPLQRRAVHGGEPGELEALDAPACRVRRGVEGPSTSGSCGAPLQLQFMSDRRRPLPESPTIEELQKHAFGTRRYTPDPSAPDPALPHQELEEPPLDGLAELLGDGAPATEDEALGAQGPLMVHDGKLCQWHAPLSKQKRPLPPRLTPLTEAEAEARGVPARVDYLPMLTGQRIEGGTLGLPDTVDTETRLVIDARTPVVEIGPLIPGVAGSRQLRGIVMEIKGQPVICIEPDAGVYYMATLTGDAHTLHFTRLRERAEINQYLRQSEELRFSSEYVQAETLRHTIAEMTFRYMQRTFSAEQHALYPSYDAYVAHFRARGYADVLDRYAGKVLSGQKEQLRFIQLGRELIPDWKFLQTCPLEERQSVADVLNALLPLEGKEADWAPLTAEALGAPEAAQQVITHMTGANLAYAKVTLKNGKTQIHFAPSGGKRASALTFRTPVDTDDVRYTNAGAAGLPPDPRLASLPVLRHDGRSRTIFFDRTKDSENDIVRSIQQLNPHDIASVEMVSTLDTCSSCGGVVLPQLQFWLRDANPDTTVSVRYLLEYSKA
jgi:hypothetical protein